MKKFYQHIVVVCLVFLANLSLNAQSSRNIEAAFGTDLSSKLNQELIALLTDMEGVNYAGYISRHHVFLITYSPDVYGDVQLIHQTLTSIYPNNEFGFLDRIKHEELILDLQ